MGLVGYLSLPRTGFPCCPQSDFALLEQGYTHGSWLNQAEIEIGIFSRQCSGGRRIPDLKTLRREALAWKRRMNRDRIKINWKFDRKAARRKLGYKGKS